MRSTGSAALNFAETQGTGSTKDYLHKAGIALKELKESHVNLKIMVYIDRGGDQRKVLMAENEELIKILRTINKNKRAQISTTGIS